MNADIKFKSYFLTFALILVFLGGIFLGKWATLEKTQNQCNVFIAKNYISNPCVKQCSKINTSSPFPLIVANITKMATD